MKNSKPRWEKKYEEYTSQGAKYAKMKSDLKALQESKVTGDFKTKQEYQEAVDSRAKQIAEYEKQLKDYENFNKNKDKIQNILEYRNELIEKLDKLPKARSEAETASLNNKKKEQEVKAQRIGQYQKEIDDLRQQLKNDLSDSDKQILLLTLKARMDSMGILQEEQANLSREIAGLEEIGKDVDEETQRKTATYERKIAKCNIIAANLLKGKELGEFEIKVVPENKTFKSNDGKFTEEVKKARAEQETDKEEQTVVKEKAENSEPEVEESSVEEVYGEPEIIDDAIEKAEEDKAIAEVSDFATKYPRLAKAGNFFKNMGSKASSFFKNIGSKLSNLFKKKDAEELEVVEAELVEESGQKEETFKEIEEAVQEQIKAEKEEGTAYKEAAAEELEDDLIYDEIISLFKKNMEKGRRETTVKKDEQSIENEENEMLQAIAEKGRKEAFREKLAVNKQQAAKNYAEKYGATYERQDRTATKTEKQENGSER